MTVTAMPDRLPAIRLRRPPLLEPCPEDVPGPASAPLAGAALLPLDWPPAAPARTAPAASRARDPRPDPATRAAATAQRYVQVCLEVLNGFRPASHLRTLAGPVEFAAVVGQLARRRNAAGHFPALGAGTTAAAPAVGRRATTAPGTPGNAPRALPAAGAPGNAARALPASGTPAAPGNGTLTAPGNAPHRVPAGARRGARANAAPAAQPYRLQRLLMSEPRPGVAEVVAVLSHAGTSMAVAMRLELRGDHWQCVVVQII